MNRWIEITESDSFGVLAIYELKRYEFENIPGSDRFCVLYLGADAAATYDALFLSGKYHVPNMIFISANFDGLAGNFYRGTPLEEIARMGNIMPKYLLIASGEPWKGYSKLNVEPGIRYGSPIYLYQYGN